MTIYFALLFLILGKTKGEWFCRKRVDALISGNPLYLPVLSFMFCCELFYLFLLGSFGYGGRDGVSSQDKNCTKDWTVLSHTTQILQMEVAKAVVCLPLQLIELTAQNKTTIDWSCMNWLWLLWHITITLKCKSSSLDIWNLYNLYKIIHQYILFCDLCWL